MCSVALLWLWNCNSTWNSFAPPTFRYLDTFSSSFSFSLLTKCTDFLYKFVKRVQSVCFFSQFHVSFIHFLNWFHCEFALFFNWAIVWAAWPPIVVMHWLGHRCCCLFWYYSYSKYNLVAIVFSALHTCCAVLTENEIYFLWHAERRNSKQISSSTLILTQRTIESKTKRLKVVYKTMTDPNKCIRNYFCFHLRFGFLHTRFYSAIRKNIQTPK